MKPLKRYPLNEIEQGTIIDEVSQAALKILGSQSSSELTVTCPPHQGRDDIVGRRVLDPLRLSPHGLQ